MNLQTLHVSQLYESVAGVAVLILFVAEVLSFKNQLWGHVFSLRLKQHQNQRQWLEGSQQKQPDIIPPDLQKSAIESLRREMTQYENKNSEKQKQQSMTDPKKQQQQQPPTVQPAPLVIPQFLGELNQSQKSTLLFYIEYNNFMAQHVSIIFSVLVLGILTNSTRIFSLASFFCYLFASLMFDFLHLQERLKAQYKKGIVLRRIVKILSICFIVGIFISYWCLDQFD